MAVIFARNIGINFIKNTALDYFARNSNLKILQKYQKVTKHFLKGRIADKI